MKKWLLAAACAVSISAPGLAAAAKPYQFAIVPKSLNNPYFDLSRDGCMAEAKKLGNVQCIYTGPVNQDAAAQVQFVQDLITRRVDGIAISVADAGSVSRVIRRARDAGIDVITFDADAPGSAREAYVGTDNRALGRAIGQLVTRLHKTPGSYAMISGGPAAQNLAQRVDGVRDVLRPAGWKEVAGSPTFCNDDSALGIQQMTDLVTAHSDLDALVPVGGWPLFAEGAYKAFYTHNKQRIDSGQLTIVSADTLAAELGELQGGMVHGLIGQQPYAMGAKAMDILLALKQGRKVSAINYVGLDHLTKDNVADFMKKS